MSIFTLNNTALMIILILLDTQLQLILSKSNTDATATTQTTTTVSKDVDKLLFSIGSTNFSSIIDIEKGKINETTTVPLKMQYTSSSSQTSSSSSSPSAKLKTSTPSSNSTTSQIEPIFIELVASLKTTLTNIRNEELGVPKIQEMYDSMEQQLPYRLQDSRDADTVLRMANKLTSKFSKGTNLVKQMRQYIEETVQKARRKLPKNNQLPFEATIENSLYHTLINPCPYDDTGSSTGYDSSPPFYTKSLTNRTAFLAQRRRQYQIILNEKDSVLDNYDEDEFEEDDDREELVVDHTTNLHKYLLERIAKMQEGSWNSAQQYFLSVLDAATNSKCQYYFDDTNFRSRFISSISNKYVVLLIDHGSSLSLDQLELSKSLAKYIIHLLKATDKVSVIGISGKAVTFSDQSCHAPTLESFLPEISEEEKLLMKNRTIKASKKYNKKLHTSPTDFYPATVKYKHMLVDFVESLNKSRELTNHSLGFEEAFAIVHDLYYANGKQKPLLLETKRRTDELPISFLYISRGLLTPITEAKSVLTAIAKGQRNLLHPITIHTCLIADEKRVMYEKQFLKDIALQNYTKYNINVSDWAQSNSTGELFILQKNHPEIHQVATSIFNHLFVNAYIDTNLQVHHPYLDLYAHDLFISLTQTCLNVGIFGIDMSLSDLMEDVLSYRGSGSSKSAVDSYAFAVDRHGTVLTHPLFPRPIQLREEIFPTDIKYLETFSGFSEVRKRLLSEDFGNHTLLNITTTHTLFSNHQQNYSSATYTWKRASDHFVFCVVSLKKAHVPQLHQQTFSSPLFLSTTPVDARDLTYHRIDIIPPLPPATLCRHFRQLATFDMSTLYLSPFAFQSPYKHLKNELNNDFVEPSDAQIKFGRVEKVLAYIQMGYEKNNDALAASVNPGLNAGIRQQISAMEPAQHFLKQQHLREGMDFNASKAFTLNKYVIRRYIANANGVLQVFPGALIDSDLEPARRPWFIKAMEYPGKIVVTEPYVDAGGAGYIVSISYTIFEGKSNALHNAAEDKPVAVVALDLPRGYFYKLLLESSSICSQETIKCFLMDDRGYLLAHPNMDMDPNVGKRNRNVEHVAHQESQVANDLLNHRYLVKKELCRNFLNRTIQRYYQFNTSLVEIFTNIVHGERAKYQITLVPGTNLFVAIVNTSFDGGASFCPCSTVDRLCLNCYRMEQTECECPCECVMTEIDECPWTTEEITEFDAAGIPTCPISPEYSISMRSLNSALDVDMKQCLSINCEVVTSQTECLGIMGCEWCQVDVDSDSLLNQPFCTSQSTCWDGVLGSMTPYGDGQLGSSIIDPIMPPVYSAIAPIFGAIVALCLVVGFAMYCYRQNVDQGVAIEHLYADSLPDCNGVPLSRFDFDDMPHDDCDFSGQNISQNLLLNPSSQNSSMMMLPNITSPYRMPSTRRPPNGDSSDHGYSTMTPHEDSEHFYLRAGIGCGSGATSSGGSGGADSLLNGFCPKVGNGHVKRLSISDSASLNTSVSTPSSSCFQPQLHLKMNHHSQYAPKHSPHLVSPTMQTTSLTINQKSPNHILVPVTVHQHMHMDA